MTAAPPALAPAWPHGRPAPSLMTDPAAWAHRASAPDVQLPATSTMGTVPVAWDVRALAPDVPVSPRDARRSAPDVHPTVRRRRAASFAMRASVRLPAAAARRSTAGTLFPLRPRAPAVCFAPARIEAPTGAPIEARRFRRIRQSRSRTRRSCSYRGSRSSSAPIRADRFVSRVRECDAPAHVMVRVPRPRLSVSNTPRVCALPYARGTRRRRENSCKNLTQA